MHYLTPQISLIFSTLIFGTVVLLNLTKKDSIAVKLYMLQSAAIAILLLLSSFQKLSLLLLIAIIATIAVKVVFAPYFFLKLIKRHPSNFSHSTFLNTPLTVAVMVLLSILTQASFFKPLIFLSPSSQDLLFISMATILISLFLSINRKGALSQALGVLSLENSIVSFALFAGLEQSPALQLGITASIFIWVTIASIFTTMIFRQFGSLDVSSMRELTE